MAGFSTLPHAVDDGIAQAPITESQAAFADEGWDDVTALNIVLADVDTGLTFELSKNLITQFEVADNLVRGYVRVQNWPNTDKPRSALSMPVVLEAIEKLMPALYLGIWGSGKDPYLVSAIGKTKPEAARARQHILRWATKKADFKEGSRLMLKSCLQYGFCVGLPGWKTETIKPRKYRKTADGAGVERDPSTKTKQIVCPTFEAANLRNTIIDPSCASQDARKGRWFAKRISVTAYDLDDMRENATYDGEGGTSRIPSREALRTILANNGEPTVDSLQAAKGNQMREYQKMPDTQAPSKDPLAQPLEILEYVSCERTVTVLQRKIVIRNEKTEEYDTLPIVSCAFIDVLNSAYGFGVARLLGGEQQFQTGVINAWVDGLALNLNMPFQTLKTLGAGSQNISIAPGKVITVDAELKPLVTTSISQEAMNALSNSDERAFRRVGADGGANIPNPAFRTGSGVQAFQGDITQRIQYFLEQYLNLAFVPSLEFFLTTTIDKLTPDQIQEILTEEDGKAYEDDILDIYNADTKIEINAGVKLTTRQAAIQVAPLLTQMLGTEPVQDSLALQGKKFNYAEFVTEYLELMGWNVDSLIVDMSPEDKQRYQAQQAATAQAMKMQAQSQLMDKAHAQDLDSIDAKATAQAGIAVIKSNLKNAESQAMSELNGKQ